MISATSRAPVASSRPVIRVSRFPSLSRHPSRAALRVRASCCWQATTKRDERTPLAVAHPPPSTPNPKTQARATAAPARPAAASAAAPSPTLAAVNAAIGAHIAKAAAESPARRTRALSTTLGSFVARVARGELPLRPAAAAAPSPKK